MFILCKLLDARLNATVAEFTHDFGLSRGTVALLRSQDLTKCMYNGSSEIFLKIKNAKRIAYASSFLQQYAIGG